MIRHVRTHSPQETEGFAATFAAVLGPGDVVALRGDLGAGKTAFVRGLARGLGIHEGEVSSPTFAIVHHYEGTAMPLYHFDMYRITDPDDVETTGFYDYLDEGRGVLAVEWSENITDLLPENVWVVTITRVDETSRDITASKGGCAC